MTQSIVTSVYPNPSVNGTITIEADQSIERVSIFGVQGALVYDQRNETAALRWTVDNLQAGAYLVQLHFTGGRTFAHQVLVR